jgi:hypothetical protein
MDVSRILKVAILSVSTPFIFLYSPTSSVLAESQQDGTGGAGNVFHEGRGNFSNGQWSIGVLECGETGTSLRYKNSKPLVLQDPEVVSRNGKKIYTWSQKGARYRLIWNPLDPKFARLEIFNTSGKKTVNTLLKVNPLPPC